ncbi:MAG: radical SAM protein [Opitutaceae bacterium]|nr:radical SAM protein [Opitutaceae bacterium]
MRSRDNDLTAGPDCVFGPLPTRRLGWSLGIDTVPAKTCNWNCVYCQLGRTHPLTNVRKAYLPERKILAAVRARLATLPAGAVDWITFVAAGEGTLHRGLGRLIRAVKRLTDLPVAVITNGSLLSLATVRRELAAADAVLPTLDAGDAELFQRINRPHRRLTFARHVAGLRAFARLKRRGRLWIEVMLVAGLNDSTAALRRMAAVLARIKPDEVHVTLPTRCPVEPWVRPPTPARVRRAEGILGARAKTKLPGLGTRGDTGAEELVGVVTRHPLRRTDLARLLPGWTQGRLTRHLRRLRAAGRINYVRREGNTFITAGTLRYPKRARFINRPKPLPVIPVNPANRPSSP